MNDKTLQDLVEPTLMDGQWTIDGATVLDIVVIPQGDDAIELLTLHVAGDKPYTIKGHAALMTEQDSPMLSGWVVDLVRGRQVYLQILPETKRRARHVLQGIFPRRVPQDETAASVHGNYSTVTMTRDYANGLMDGASKIQETHKTVAPGEPHHTMEEAADGVSEKMEEVTHPQSQPQKAATLTTTGGEQDEAREAAVTQETPPHPTSLTNDERGKETQPRKKSRALNNIAVLLFWPIYAIACVAFIFNLIICVAFIVNLIIKDDAHPMERYPETIWIFIALTFLGYGQAFALLLREAKKKRLYKEATRTFKA